MKVTPQMAAAGEVVFSRMCGEFITDYLFGCEVATAIYAAMEVERLADFHENHQAGLDRARAQGRLKGRRSIIDVARFRALLAEHGPQKAAEEMGIGKTTAYRLIRAEKKAANATRP